MSDKVSYAQLQATVCEVLRPTLDRIINDAEHWVVESRSATAEGASYTERTAHRHNASALSETLRGSLIDAELLGKLRDAVDSLYATYESDTASHNPTTENAAQGGGCAA